MSQFQILFDNERQAFAAARKAYFTRHRLDRRRELTRHAYDRLRVEESKATDAHDRAKADLAQAWDRYSKRLAPLPIITEGDACVWDLSDAGADEAVDNLIRLGAVTDPHGYHRAGQLDARKFMAWYLRLARTDIVVGRDR